MIVEVAILEVIKGQEKEFEADFKTASKLISAIKGYMGHSLRKCMEQENKYILLVDWQSIENHTKDFRESEEYKTWKQLLHHYYSSFPLVEHYETVLEMKK